MFTYIKSNRVASFEVYYYQMLDPAGQLNIEDAKLHHLPAFVANKTMLLKMYTYMKKARLFDAKAINLQKTGKIGTYPSSLWHEAIGVAIGSSMDSQDLFCPYYRDLATMLWRGVLMEEILAYWGGCLEGSNFKVAVHDFPICVPIASQVLHAVGAAFASKYKKSNQVVVTTIGDGGTSKGDFYEALNLASLWELPVVFVIINNQFAISTPRRLQTKAATLAQKAIAAGIECEQVDGNDVLGLRARLDLAINMARCHYQPKVIEAITYRMGDHTTADDASRYRSNEEIQAHLATDPLLRFKLFLQTYHDFTEQEDHAIIEHCQQEIECALNNYYLMPTEYTSDQLFDHLYKSI
jgi:2-oxoisovalerate dehydrogenase E1 component alpha subunit